MGCSAEILAVFFDSSWAWHALFARTCRAWLLQRSKEDLFCLRQLRSHNMTVQMEITWNKTTNYDVT